MNSEVSIIICTRNRAESLRLTLDAISGLAVPQGWKVELLVVDNGSSDNTRQVIRESRLPNLSLRYVEEPTPGLSFARNTGLSMARGSIIIFTDDDVRPVNNWIELLVKPLLENKADATGGGIKLADHLHRAWMEPVHLMWLAATAPGEGRAPEMIGANMAFNRAVLERVPSFDTELGAGRLGFMEDTLFWKRLVAEGYRVVEVPEALVVHHLDSSRLIRSEWLKAARQRGDSLAYVWHHWCHAEFKLLWLRCLFLSAKLFIRRLLQPPPAMKAEGSPPWELSYVYERSFCRKFMEVSKKPRKYNECATMKYPLSILKFIFAGLNKDLPAVSCRLKAGSKEA